MKTILITGATSGFGQLMTEEFLRAGDRVIATGRNLMQRQEILKPLRQQFGQNLIELDLDVTDRQQITEVTTSLTNRMGRVDALINNAGYGQFGALEDVPEEQARQQIEINFFGTVAMTQAFLPLLRTSRGRIINFSSVYGFLGFPLTSLYCASKFAVEGLSESLAHELKPHGVQVCLIEPGGFNTGFNDRLQWPEASLTAGSPYLAQTRNYQELHKRSMKRPFPSDPRALARSVVRLTHRRTMPRRARFGIDAQITYWSRRLLPEFLFFAILRLFFKFTLEQRAKTT